MGAAGAQAPPTAAQPRLAGTAGAPGAACAPALARFQRRARRVLGVRRGRAVSERLVCEAQAFLGACMFETALILARRARAAVDAVERADRERAEYERLRGEALCAEGEAMLALGSLHGCLCAVDALLARARASEAHRLRCRRLRAYVVVASGADGLCEEELAAADAAMLAAGLEPCDLTPLASPVVTFTAADWHRTRRRLMLQRHGPAIRPLYERRSGEPGEGATLVLVLFAVSSLHLALAAAAGRLESLVALVALAASFGAAAAYGIQALNHDLSHVGRGADSAYVAMVLSSALCNFPWAMYYLNYHAIHHAVTGSDMDRDGDILFQPWHSPPCFALSLQWPHWWRSGLTLLRWSERFAEEPSVARATATAVAAAAAEERVAAAGAARTAARAAARTAARAAAAARADEDDDEERESAEEDYNVKPLSPVDDSPPEDVRVDRTLSLISEGELEEVVPEEALPAKPPPQTPSPQHECELKHRDFTTHRCEAQAEALAKPRAAGRDLTEGRACPASPCASSSPFSPSTWAAPWSVDGGAGVWDVVVDLAAHPTGRFLWMCVVPLLLYPMFLVRKMMLDSAHRPSVEHDGLLMAGHLVAFRLGGVRALLYLWLSAGFSLGLACHPLLGFWLIQHQPRSREPRLSARALELCDRLGAGVVALPMPQPSLSYSGSWLWGVVNFGELQHVEHHDFPAVVAAHYPQLRRAAPEFFDCLESCPSVLAAAREWLMAGDDEQWMQTKGDFARRDAYIDDLWVRHLQFPEDSRERADALARRVALAAASRSPEDEGESGEGQGPAALCASCGANVRPAVEVSDGRAVVLAACLSCDCGLVYHRACVRVLARCELCGADVARPERAGARNDCALSLYELRCYAGHEASCLGTAPCVECFALYQEPARAAN
jgi:fatty acid desaturase